MKIFGKDLFSFKSKAGAMWDFNQFGISNASSLGMNNWTNLTTNIETVMEKPKKKKKLLTPKQLFKLQALNDNNFTINADPTYLEKQIDIAEQKLDFLGKPKKIKKDDLTPIEFGPIKYGREELESIIERLKNRKRLSEFEEIINKYPHTTSKLIKKVLDKNSHLGNRRIENFVPDMPSQALKEMRIYNEMCIALCNKKSIFYIIAKNEDFEKQYKRRDPILLAQSPFGFFWQILGAWDKEMVYLGDL